MTIKDFITRRKIYDGAECVAKVLSMYRSKLESRSRRYSLKKPRKVWRWHDKNQFFIFIHKSSRSLMGIRTKKKGALHPWKFLFRTEHVPVATCDLAIIPRLASADVITSVAVAVLDQFQREVDDMLRFTNMTPAMPLFLLKYCGDNDYIAWSLQEGKYVEVSDYKSYRQIFNVRDIGKGTSPTSSEGRYVIIPPSDELIKGLGLPIDSAIFGKKCSWDEWVPRAPIEGYNDIIPEAFRSRYTVCIETLNRSYAKDLGHEVEFYQLEERVHRLERLCQLKAPEQIVAAEIGLIERVLPTLENLR